MRIENQHGLPETIIRALHKQQDMYNAGEVDSSVTQLIQPARISLLRKKHYKEMVKDVSEEFYALLGSGVHYLLELGATSDMIVEERLFMTIDNWRISGAIDVQEIVNEREVDIIDYKITSTYSVTGDEPKGDWVNQLNLQALLLEANKPMRVRKLTICAILRDWSSTKARLDPMYPQAPIVMVPIPIWSKHAQQAYARERIEEHRQARIDAEFGDALKECTPEDRWVKGEAWVVRKKGAKRAVRSFDNPVEADQLAATKGKDYAVEYREGKSVRCDFCGVSQWCDQFAAMNAKDEADGPDPVPEEAE